MVRSKKYKEELSRALKNPREAESYLNTALEDSDIRVFLLALKDVAEARLGSLTALSKKTKLNRENLYRMLSSKGNPEVKSLELLLEALGFKLLVKFDRAA